MKRQDQVIKLLLIEDSVEEAEQLISMLRNGGIAVRPARAENSDELVAQLDGHTPDVILVNPEAKSIKLSDVASIANLGGKDIAIIAVAKQPTENLIVSAFNDGARALALRNRAEHVQSIVRREFESLNMRRSVRRLEAALRETERRCDALLDSSRDPIAYVHEGMHVRANKAYLDMFGYDDFADVEGMSILDMIAPHDADDFKALLKKVSKGEKPPQRLNLTVQRADGTMFPSVMEFGEANYEGEPCQQISFRIADDNADLARELDVLRSKDLVTELFNRQHGLTELERMVRAVANGAHDQAIVIVEPDDFKRLLDTVGLGNADLMLGDMAALMRQHLQESDIAIRLSEHTFAFLSNGRSTEALRQLAETLRKAFEEHIFEVGKQSINANVSIAGVVIGEKNASVQAILAQVNHALRAVQSEGGNRVNVFDPAAQDKAKDEENRHWLSLVKDAIENAKFVLFYQPIISLHAAEGEYYEIFLRMRGPKGDISPTFFMPVAEQHGLLPRIDRCVIREAIVALAEREKAGHRTTFFIKLTPQSLEDQTLVPWISQQLKNARVRGDAIVFEMPESKVVTSLKPARSFVSSLKQIHCGFALEQFGSGLNSFQLLKHVDANYLKIDRSFMADLPKNKENQDKIRDICDQARQSDKMTVAEFVEDAASMSILFSCGVNFVQGNFLQEPEKVMAYEFGS
ncbi:MAG TPA: EAL domain-containing protein [Rudaea sp.]|nr:EAL domain-containing protein [Rudaea sp.]